LTEGERGILAALVGVVNGTAGPPLLERHVECVKHQLDASEVSIAQPTILRLQASSTTAR
jgi:hypothetical protein